MHHTEDLQALLWRPVVVRPLAQDIASLLYIAHGSGSGTGERRELSRGCPPKLLADTLRAADHRRSVQTAPQRARARGRLRPRRCSADPRTATAAGRTGWTRPRPGSACDRAGA